MDKPRTKALSLLETVVEKNDLYKPAFIQGLDRALREVTNGSTKKAESFDEFIG